MTLYLREVDVATLLTMDVALRAVEEAVRGQCLGSAVNIPRARLRGGRTSLQVMVGAVPSLGVMGYKAYTVTRQGARFLVLLYSTETGELLAILEASKLGQMRTGAASGIATRHMARADASSVGIYGSGYQARSQLMAVAAVRPLRWVRAYSRNRQRLEAFCHEMGGQLGVAVEPAQEPQAVAQGADILITATSASEPVLRGEWLSPGVHINAIGANHWLRRELDEEALRRSDIIVVDSREQARIECGDLLWAVERGATTWGRVRELGEVVAGIAPGRKDAADITLFESHGLAIWDVATAAHVYQLAQERGLGKTLLL